MITVKKESEIQKMREAGAIVGETLKMIEEYIKPGISTNSLNSLIEDYIVAKGAIPSFKNYNGFPAAACISIDKTVVHGIPSDRELKEGEIVSIDVGALYKGFHGDAARTFGVGKIDAIKQQFIDTARESFFEGIRHARAGCRLGDISHAIQDYVEKRGYGVVREMVGHGIGRKLHEPPNVPNYGCPNSGIMLKSGYALAIEPMITMGDYRIFIESDGWTCNTIDGSPAAHYENTIIITGDEPEILTL